MIRRPLAALALLILAACGGDRGPRAGEVRPAPPVPHPPPVSPAEPGDPSCFQVRPYLQMGDAPGLCDRVTLCWDALDGAGPWMVELRTVSGPVWTRMAEPSSRLIDVPPARAPRHRVWSCLLAPLVPGRPFDYRVWHQGRPVFEEIGAQGRVELGQAQRVAVAGDLVEPRDPGGRAIAYQIHAQRPSLVVTAGDLVYPNGTQGEYLKHFFPAYNAAADDPGTGAPLMAGALLVGVLGNHDVAQVGRRMIPPGDSLAYYYFYDQPRNGPDLLAGGHHPNLSPPRAWTGFREAAGDRYPGMGNFVFDSGPARWLVLDSNRYVHWQDPALRAWLASQLDASPPGAWRFVVFHHPGFSLSTFGHTGDWQMRQLWPLFQQHQVDLVFTGHLHTYQRTRPFTFTPTPPGVSDASHCGNEANIIPDLDFDGVHRTTARGPIEIVTGCGGGRFYGGEHRPKDPPKSFHAKAVVNTNGFALLDLEPHRLKFRELDRTGGIMDAFELTK